MPFLTLRNKGWLGGDVTIEEAGDFLVLEIRDIAPIRGYVIVDLVNGTITRGDWKSLHEAQKAATALRSGK